MRLTAIPVLVDNYVWLLDDGANAIAVDPGVAKPLLDALAARSLRLTGILLTHHHPDHVAGTAEVMQMFPGARVFAPPDPRIVVRAHRVVEGQKVCFEEPEFVASVFEIPGHTSTHVAYFGSDALFCGDTLFSLGCGRMFEGTPEQFSASLSRLAALPASTRVCCGHEYTLANGAFATVVDPDNAALSERIADASRMRGRGAPSLPSSIGEECATNPFLRTGDRAIVAALTQRHGRPPGDGIEAFAWLRAWKDEFRVAT